MKFIKKPYAYASILGLLLTGSFSYSMLKTFVLAETISTVAATNTSPIQLNLVKLLKQQQ